MIFKPHIGLQPKRQTLTSLDETHTKVTREEAKKIWEEQYEMSNNQCSHVYGGGRCTRIENKLSCNIGVRQRTMHILSGSVLLAWGDVENVLGTQAHGSEKKMQVVRVRGEDFKIIGLLIPNNCVNQIKYVFSDPEYLKKKDQKNGALSASHNPEVKTKVEESDED